MPNRAVLSIGGRRRREVWCWGPLTLSVWLALSACAAPATPSVISAEGDEAVCRKFFPNGVPPELKRPIPEIPGLEQQPGEKRDEFGLLPFRPTQLTPEQRARFEQWWNSGEVLAWRKETGVHDPIDPTYDYAGAFLAGIEPKLVREVEGQNASRRWRSVVGGRWLKSIAHPTYFISKAYEERAGKCRRLIELSSQ